MCSFNGFTQKNVIIFLTYCFLLQMVKVADFGVACVRVQSWVMTAETGTYRWMALEVISPLLTTGPHQLACYWTMFSYFNILLVLCWKLTCVFVRKSLESCECLWCLASSRSGCGSARCRAMVASSPGQVASSLSPCFRWVSGSLLAWWYPSFNSLLASFMLYFVHPL